MQLVEVTKGNYINTDKIERVTIHRWEGPPFHCLIHFYSERGIVETLRIAEEGEAAQIIANLTETGTKTREQVPYKDVFDLCGHQLNILLYSLLEKGIGIEGVETELRRILHTYWGITR